MKLIDYLLEKKIAQNKSQAEGFILAGLVLVNDIPIYHKGYSIKEGDIIRIKQKPPFVSRAALKIYELIQKWNFPVLNRDFADIGSATGGFTEVLLQLGAKRVLAIDVGYGLLHPSLRKDPRVFVYEKTNFLRLKQEDLPFLPQNYVADVSFVSLKRIIEKITTWAREDTCFLGLLKPQFEISKSERIYLKKGILKNEEVRKKTIAEFFSFCQKNWEIVAQADSPIKGQKGNQEVVFYLKFKPPSCP